MKRADWLDKMWETIEAHEGRAFAWGVDDCCLFAARVYDAMHDTHHAEALAARYHDEASALEYIEAQGGIGPAVCEYLGEMRQVGATRSARTGQRWDNGGTIVAYILSAQTGTDREAAALLY